MPCVVASNRHASQKLKYRVTTSLIAVFRAATKPMFCVSNHFYTIRLVQHNFGPREELGTAIIDNYNFLNRITILREQGFDTIYATAHRLYVVTMIVSTLQTRT